MHIYVYIRAEETTRAVEESMFARVREEVRHIYRCIYLYIHIQIYMDIYMYI